MMWDIPLGMGWVWLFGGLWMIIFWGGLIALIVWIVKKVSDRGVSSPPKDPLQLAKERYAGGEINQKEFEQLKKDLS